MLDDLPQPGEAKGGKGATTQRSDSSGAGLSPGGMWTHLFDLPRPAAEVLLQGV